MHDAVKHSLPYKRNYHLPFVKIEEVLLALSASDINKTIDEMPYSTFWRLAQLSAARCCQVSYDNVDGSASNIENDIRLYEKLITHDPLHASPFEHQAFCGYTGAEEPVNSARNFAAPWIQNRSLVEFCKEKGV